MTVKVVVCDAVERAVACESKMRAKWNGGIVKHGRMSHNWSANTSRCSRCSKKEVSTCGRV